MPLTPFVPTQYVAPAAPTPFEPNTTGTNAPLAPARGIITSATGGGSQALDGQLVSLWRIGEAVFVVGETVSLWQLQAGTHATDAEAGYVRPADFHATLNARVFVRLVIAGVGGGGGGAVSSVAGRTGAVLLTKADVGLGAVDNTADADKPISTAQAAALATKANASSLGAHTSDTGNPHAVTKAQVGLGNVTNDAQVKRVEMGAASGVATLGADGKLPAAQLPSIAVVDYLGRVASQSAMLAKSAAEQGDWLIRNDTGTVWIMTGSNPASLSSWTALEYPVAPVTSVAGRTGDIALTKADVGLPNVDNTADAAKPISTAQQAALDAKAPLASPALTGIPSAPTAAADTNTTQLATTAFAKNEADVAQAFAIQRANHTGTQPAATISDFGAAASAAAPVQSVAGRTGAVTLTKSDVGLGNVDNTADAAKPISTAQQAALDGKLAVTARGAVNGVAPLDASGLLPTDKLPAVLDGIIQIRGGTTAELAAVVLGYDATAKTREIAYDSDYKGFRIGDGATPGGITLNSLPIPKPASGSLLTGYNALASAMGEKPRIKAEYAPSGALALWFPEETFGAYGGIATSEAQILLFPADGSDAVALTVPAAERAGFCSPNTIFAFSPASGGTQFIGGGADFRSIILSHPTTIAALTLSVSRQTATGAVIRIVSKSAITAVAWNWNGAVFDSTNSPLSLPTSLAAGQVIELQVLTSASDAVPTLVQAATWVRIL